MTPNLQSLHNDVATLTKMVAALLKDQSTKGMNRYHVIGGYVYGQTGNNDPFVILYPIQEYLTEKICRVYPQDFKKLPSFINTKDVPGDTDENPDKGKAMKRGIYHECPAFGVATFPGKMTQMGPEVRFSDVLWVSGKGQTYQKETQEDGGEESQTQAETVDTPQEKAGNGVASTATGDGFPDPLPRISRDELKRLNALGLKYYGAAGWDTKVAEIVSYTTKGKSKNPAELTPTEATPIIAGLEERINQASRQA